MSGKTIQEMIAIYPEKDKLPCAVAHYIAAFLKVDPLEVGRKATEETVRIYQCQLGLFGFGRKGRSTYKITGRKVEVGDEIPDQIKSCAKAGRISCAELWNIADGAGIIRAEAGNAADALGIKITPCQLGAF